MFLQERKDMFSLLQSCNWNFFFCCLSFGEKLETVEHVHEFLMRDLRSTLTFLCTGKGWWHGMIHVSGWNPFQTLPTSGTDRDSCCGSGGGCRWGMTAACLLTAALQRQRRPSEPRSDPHSSHFVVFLIRITLIMFNLPSLDGYSHLTFYYLCTFNFDI